MDRRPISILLAIIIALQACLAGFAVCSKGGCCHAEAEAAHVDDEHGDVHEHSAFVNSDAPHPCDCTDHEIDAGDAVPGKRDEAPTPAPDAYVFAGPVHDYRPSIASIAKFERPRARGDAANLQRLAVLRATRLQL